MLRYLLNPKHLTSINRKQTGCEQKSGPHNRYANSSFPLPGSGIGWISCCVKPHSLLPADVIPLHSLHPQRRHLACA